MKFTCEQLVDSFTKKYIEDVGSQAYFEMFTMFDLIMKEYNETNKCLICVDGQGQYGYNNTKIACQYEVFYVGNDIVSFGMKANYCPVCGKYIGKED